MHSLVDLILPVLVIISYYRTQPSTLFDLLEKLKSHQTDATTLLVVKKC